MTGHADTAHEAAVKTALDAYTAAGAAVLSIARRAGRDQAGMARRV